MKTQEELNEMKENTAPVNEEQNQLADNELEQVSGGLNTSRILK